MRRGFFVLLWGLLHLAGAVAQELRVHERLEQIEARLEAEPEDLPSRLEMVHYLRQMGRLRAAREHVEKAIQRDPSNLEVAYQAAMLRISERDYGIALREVRVARRLARGILESPDRPQLERERAQRLLSSLETNTHVCEEALARRAEVDAHSRRVRWTLWGVIAALVGALAGARWLFGRNETRR